MVFIKGVIGEIGKIGKTNQFYIDRKLKEELDILIKKIKKEWGFCGIISSSNLNKIGSSTMALQIGSYVAWRVAGGRAITDDKGKLKRTIKAKRPLNFSSYNIVYDKKDLKRRARKEKSKTVFIYELDKKELTNKKSISYIEETISECLSFDQILLIVVKDFRKLSFNIAVENSKFLVNLKLNDKKLKGCFNFYKDERKSLMHHRRNSIYNTFTPNFSGSFTSWKPIFD